MSEINRKDKHLKRAIAIELDDHRNALKQAHDLMLQAYKILVNNTRVDETPSQIDHRIMVNLFSDAASLDWYQQFLGTVSDTYYGNIATRLSEAKIKELKEKYPENPTDK
jgi:hypothetical protein